MSTSPFPTLPSSEVRILSARVEPWPDGLRVRVHLALTPFEQPPNLTAQILDNQKRLLAQADIIETISARLVFTMHLRGGGSGDLRLLVTVSYPDLGEIDSRTISFRIDAAAA
jgi:hypothetical protein